MLIEKFTEQVNKTPGKIAVKTGKRTLTYEELDHYADRIAAAIETGWPGHKEGQVGLLLEHGVDMIAAILGALKAGKAYVPLSPDYPTNRISYMLRHSDSGLVVSNSKCAEKAKKVALESDIDLLDIDEIGTSISNAGVRTKRREKVGEDSLAYIMYTSGSTGKPKGVVQTHRNVLYYTRNWTQRFSITEADRMTLFSSFCHDGSVQDMFSALQNGATLYPYDMRKRDDNVNLSRFLNDEKITIWHSVPSLFNFFVNTLTGEEHFASLRWLLLGGEPFRGYEIAMFKKYFPGASLADVYGQTESSVSSIWTITATDPISHLIIGKPLDNTRILLINEDGNRVDPLETGEILISCPHISPGYWKDQELTKKSFGVHPEYGTIYWTGDLGRLLVDGNIEFMGRKDFQVKIRGFRVEIGEIETALLQMDVIKEAVVAAKVSETGNTYLCAFLTAARELDVFELRDYLSKELPDYMMPLHFNQLEKMPLTQSGKIDRKALSLMEIEPLKSRSLYLEPKTGMEKTIARIWEEILKLESVGIHDNLFEVGGNSFDIIKINSKLSELLQLDIPIVKLFEYPTIEDLAGYLTSLTGDNEKGMAIQNPGSDRINRGISAEIAVIGMAGRFPGAKNIDAFWENLKNGVESISFFSEEELIESGVPGDLVKDPSYVNAKGILEDIELFDAAFFNFTPREAAIMDPQLRVFHECAWEALENAGYSPYNYDGPIGVYSGNTLNIDWLARVYTQKNTAVGELEKGFFNNHFSTFVSYKLDLTGPSVTIRTACSTSLVAVHEACKGLILNECDMALAGGVSIQTPNKVGYLYQEGMILSPDGHVRTFDANSKGTIFGDGAGCVVLKRLKDADTAGDYIYAVIKGSAVNNDGIRKVGYSAPGITGQREVVRAAMSAARFDPKSIGFIETHGTGTILGDAVEIESLNQLFPRNSEKYCALGSVKTNVGHLNAAAGIAGFIKTVLALKYKQIPPTLHFETPNPTIDFENSPFYVNTNLKEWARTNGHPLRAGVSSFGFGGTNAHVVLEEYASGGQEPNLLIGTPRRGALDPEKTFNYLLLLSARTPSALDKMTENLARYLQENPDADLDNVVYTLQVGRKYFPYRRMTVCSNAAEATGLLGKKNKKVKSFFTKIENRPVIFVLSGQGSQYVNMGLDLYKKVKIFREELDRCFNIIKREAGFDIKEILYPGENPGAHENSINLPTNASLVNFIIEYTLAKLLSTLGITPYAMIGYSFGEYVAACLAGVFSLEDGLKLVIDRGKLMSKTLPAVMLSVPLPENEIELLLKDHPGISLAIINGSSCVVAGEQEAIRTFEAQMRARRLVCVPVNMAHGVHSPLMEPIRDELENRVREIKLESPRIPYISNVSGSWISVQQATDPRYWGEHICSTVRFSQGLGELAKKHDAVFLEIGPGRVLGNIIQQQMRPANEDRDQDPGPKIINTIKHQQEKMSDDYFLLSRLGELWLYGISLDWSVLYGEEKRYRIPLPTYPFDRKRYWIDQELPTLLSESQFPDSSPVLMLERTTLDEEEYESPRDEMEETIARLWQEFLGFERIGIHDNFFDINGDSLTATRLIPRIQQIYPVEISIKQFFENPTIAHTADLVKELLVEKVKELSEDELERISNL
ncbi:MAG: hypothetical protein QG657_5181 [Acidobacteriota bacterium]|nr:hypothetical protein [Acidobacteriota bacterium]